MKLFGSSGLAGKILILPIRGYQKFISPLLPPMCRYYPSCSRYAVEALQKRNVFTACLMIIWRLLRCNPLSKGGYDPVDKDPPENDSRQAEV